MRSEHLERGLDSVGSDSPLRPFRDIFRKGRKNEDKTFAQHLRNALAHGTFELKDENLILKDDFQGRSWTGTIQVEMVLQLAEHIFRFYCLAFEIGRSKFTEGNAL